jgi:hypothetical protein
LRAHLLGLQSSPSAAGAKHGTSELHPAAAAESMVKTAAAAATKRRRRSAARSIALDLSSNILACCYFKTKPGAWRGMADQLAPFPRERSVMLL